MGMRVAFQGEIGAFSEEAALALYPGADPVAYPSFEAVFGAASDGLVDRAVIPIENSLHGSVHANYDLLQEHDLTIVAEFNLRIRHNLLAKMGTRREQVRRVLSHPQALGQCRQFLRSQLAHAEFIPAYDTAGAAKIVAETRENDLAAIASEKAAAEYGLHVLAAGIESNHENYTRFLALSKRPEDREPARSSGAHKTSIVYSMRENVPGALFKSLAVFALRDLDLFKIESRPLIGSPGNYLFYLDLKGKSDAEPVRNALNHLREIAAYVKILGSYPAAKPVEPCS